MLTQLFRGCISESRDESSESDTRINVDMYLLLSQIPNHGEETFMLIQIALTSRSTWKGCTIAVNQHGQHGPSMRVMKNDK